MSATGLKGKPGAGKSYEAVKRCEDAVKAGRAVITNLPLKMTHPLWMQAQEDGLIYGPGGMAGFDLPDDELDFGKPEIWKLLQSKKKPFHRDIKVGKGTQLIGPLVVVDETFSAFREMIRLKRKEPHWGDFIEFVTKHRHHLTDIIFLFQAHSQCDGDLKPLIERWHTVVNTSAVTAPVNTYQLTVSNKPHGSNTTGKIDGTRGVFKQEVFDLYDSYAEGSGTGMEGKKSEKGTRGVRPIWMRPSFIILALGLVLLPVLGWKAFGASKSVLSGESKPGEFGENRVASMITPQDLDQLQAMPAFVPVVETEAHRIAKDLGWPSPDTSLVGFDNDVFYFTDGSQLVLREDILPKGWGVSSSSLCRVEFVKVTARVGLVDDYEFIHYTCVRGF